MKRKLVCGTCNTSSKHPDTGKTLYIYGDANIIGTMPRVTECLECGDKRRSREERRRKEQSERLLKTIDAE
jgi:hypothetical protein